MIRPIEKVESGEDLRILDQRGCLTPEAMCLPEQLTLHHLGAVERHIKACTACAQQVAELTRAADRLRAARPLIAVPPEVRLLSQQIATYSPAMLDRRSPKAAAQRPMRNTAKVARLASPWQRPSSILVAILGAMLAATIVVLMILLSR